MKLSNLTRVEDIVSAVMHNIKHRPTDCAWLFEIPYDEFPNIVDLNIIQDKEFNNELRDKIKSLVEGPIEINYHNDYEGGVKLLYIRRR